MDGHMRMLVIITMVLNMVTRGMGIRMVTMRALRE